VPADPLLAPLFADLPPGQAGRLAAWLAGALGGPARSAMGDVRKAAGFTAPEFGEQQRARWVRLAGIAADEAVLPGDPGFRSALSSCIDWVSRAAMAGPDSGPAGQPQPAPRWDWGPGGPPGTTAVSEGDQAGQPDPQLPEPGQPVGFAAHIKPLFRPQDRQSMSFAFDLWSFDDVRARAAGILTRLQEGSMPCDGAWPAEKIEVFKRWADSGMRP
jgi:truncated hemoglobin YjbI